MTNINSDRSATIIDRILFAVIVLAFLLEGFILYSIAWRIAVSEATGGWQSLGNLIFLPIGIVIGAMRLSASTIVLFRRSYILIAIAQLIIASLFIFNFFFLDSIAKRIAPALVPYAIEQAEIRAKERDEKHESTIKQH